MIELNLWLYGKPSWDMEIEGKKELDPALLRSHASFMKKHLESTAEIIEKLQQAGWKLAASYGAVYTLTFYKRTSKFQVERELATFDIDLKEIHFEQIDDW